MSHFRASGRVAALALLGAALIPAQLLVAGPLFKDFETIPALLWKGVRKIMGISVRFNGAAIRRDRPMLYMANHISVLDPFIIAAISKNSGFVAMKRLGDWPVIGRFAKGIGTVLASNNQSAAALPDIHERLTGLLNAGRNVTFCPEGKITDGKVVAEFKTGIISVGFNNLASKGLNREIGYQPFALKFKRINGRDVESSPALREIFVNSGNGNLRAHVWRMLGVKSLEAELFALPAMDPADYKDARHLADTARSRIMAALSLPQPGGV